MKLLLLVPAFLITACGPVDPPQGSEQELDSLRKQMVNMERRLDSISSLIPTTEPHVIPADQNEANSEEAARTEPTKPQQSLPPTDRQTTVPLKKKTAPEEKQQQKDPNSDTLRHFYTNGLLSAMRTPFVNGYAKWYLYDLKGAVTCELEEARHSFTVSIDLHFHPNGAVKEAVIHNNPGASRYWYESVAEFDTTNQPGWMRTRRYPMDSLEDMETHWYWDKASRSWKKQETVIEQITPGQ